MLLSFTLLATTALATSIGIGIDTPSPPSTPVVGPTSPTTTLLSPSCPSTTIPTPAVSSATAVSNKATIFFIVVNAISMTINAVIVSSHIKHKRLKKNLEAQLRYEQEMVEEQKNCLKLEIMCKRGELDVQGMFLHARRGCRGCSDEVRRSCGGYGDWDTGVVDGPRPAPEVNEGGDGRGDGGRLSDISTLGRQSVVEHEETSTFVGTEQTKRSRRWKSKTLLRKKSLGLAMHDRWVGAPEGFV